MLKFLHIPSPIDASQSQNKHKIVYYSKFDSRQSRLTFNLTVGYLPILEDVRGLDGLIFPGVVVGVGVAVPLRGRAAV